MKKTLIIEDDKLLSNGVGIGLYLTREIVTAQGGYIQVLPNNNKGSIFKVYLPKQGRILQYCKILPCFEILLKDYCANIKLINKTVSGREKYMIKLQTNSLYKQYSNGEFITKALDNVSVTINNGEFIAIAIDWSFFCCWFAFQCWF